MLASAAPRERQIVCSLGWGLRLIRTLECPPRSGEVSDEDAQAHGLEGREGVDDLHACFEAALGDASDLDLRGVATDVLAGVTCEV